MSLLTRAYGYVVILDMVLVMMAKLRLTWITHTLAAAEDRFYLGHVVLQNKVAADMA